MRITFCHNETEYLCDAQSVFLRRLMPALRALGHEPRLLLIAPRDPSVCSLAAFCRDHGIEFAATHSRGSMGNNVRWCLRQLATNPPDVFVAHHCYWALYASPWLREAGIPSVAVLHSDDAPTKRLIDVFCHADSPVRVSGAVAVSDVIQAQALACRAGLPVASIPCGVPTPDAPITRPGAGLRIAYFGRIVQEQKRILDLGRAFARVARELPAVECHIWGSGAEDAALARVLADEPGGERVQCHAAIPADEVYDRLREHEVVVLLSDYEGTPTSVMEGMANGLVPVVTDIGGGTRALVEHGVTGLVVRDRGDDFIRAIAGLAADRELWSRLSTAAAQRIRSRFSVGRTAELWSEFAATLAPAPGRRTAIRVPGPVDIPERWRIAGPHYFNRVSDVVAGLYADARHAAHRATARREEGVARW